VIVMGRLKDDADLGAILGNEPSKRTTNEPGNDAEKCANTYGSRQGDQDMLYESIRRSCERLAHRSAGMTLEAPYSAGRQELDELLHRLEDSKARLRAAFGDEPKS
jgi:hypothetical protein